jgi:tetratricopeptide (TPR) repeat protein
MGFARSLAMLLRRAALVVFSGLIVVLTGTTATQQEILAPDGWAALQRGDAEKAAAIFREALDRSPMNPTLHYGAGFAAYLLGRYDPAIYSLKKALEFDPKFFQAAAVLGQVAYARGDLGLAIRSLEKALTIKPGDPSVSAQLERWRSESSVHAGLEERATTRFRVLFEGTAQKAIGDRVARVLESAYQTVGKALNNYPSEALTVILYTEQQFEAVTRSPAWAEGQFDGRIRLAVRGAMSSPQSLDRLVVHEFVHAVIASIAPRNIPAWVHEGLATNLESTDRAWAPRVLATRTQRIRLQDLEGGFDRFDSSLAQIAYAESAIAAQLLQERLGFNLGMFLQMLGTGHTINQALSYFDIRPEEFEAAWRKRIGMKP